MDLTQFRDPSYVEPAKPLLDPLLILSPQGVKKVIAFDQALAETGYVVIQGLHTHSPPRIETTGMLTATDDVKGHEKTLLRASTLYWEVKDLIAFHKPTMDNLRLIVVHETPPIANKMSRPESSLLASLAIRVAAMESGCRVVMHQRQRAYKRFTGSANADKKFMKEALTKLLEAREIALPKGPWNQHVVDALGIGLLEIEEKE